MWSEEADVLPVTIPSKGEFADKLKATSGAWYAFNHYKTAGFTSMNHSAAALLNKPSFGQGFYVTDSIEKERENNKYNEVPTATLLLNKLCNVGFCREPLYVYRGFSQPFIQEAVYTEKTMARGRTYVDKTHKNRHRSEYFSKQMQIGDVVTFPTFLSTSWDPQVALQFFDKGATSSGPESCCFVRFVLPEFFPHIYANVGSYAWERELILPFMYLEPSKPWHRQPLKWTVISKKRISTRYRTDMDKTFSPMKRVDTTMYTLVPQNWTQYNVPMGRRKARFRAVTLLPVPKASMMERSEAEAEMDLPVY